MSWFALCAPALLCVLLSAAGGRLAVAQPGTAQGTAAYLSLLQRYESGDYEGAAKTALTLNPAVAHELGRLVIIEDIKDQIVQRATRIIRSACASPAARAIALRSARASPRLCVSPTELWPSVIASSPAAARFGASPYLQRIGLGQSANVERLEVVWPASGVRQSFATIAAGQTIEIREDGSTTPASTGPRHQVR